MDKVEIYEWLKSQKYQTGYDEVGEYVMYYSVDMPRILEDYYEYKVKKLNEPAVSGTLPVDGVEAILLDCKNILSQCESATIGTTQINIKIFEIDRFIENRRMGNYR